MDLDSIEICRQLECWYEKPAGQYLLGEEQSMVEELLDKVFGYHLLQLGVTRNQVLGESSSLNHKIFAGGGPAAYSGLVTYPDQLPFLNDSIDAVILHHSMEFAHNPHQLLREVARVLAPQGHVVVVGFNPLSLFGLGMLLQRPIRRGPWQYADAMAPYRLRDWLHLLGCEVDRVSHSFSCPPVGSGRFHQTLVAADKMIGRWAPPIGGVYALHAQKQVSTLTPMKLRWERKMGARLIGLAVPRPVATPCEGDVAA